MKGNCGRAKKGRQRKLRRVILREEDKKGMHTEKEKEKEKKGEGERERERAQNVWII